MRDPDPIRGGGELVENWLRYQGHDAQADKIAALLAEIERLRETLSQIERADLRQTTHDGLGTYAAPPAEQAALMRGLARAALATEAHRTKEPSECAPDGDPET